MKKAMKFSDWCYKTLSDEETKTLNDVIDKTLETLEKRKEAGTEKISVVQKGDKK